MKKFFSILILTAFSLPYAFSQKIIIINVTSSKAAVKVQNEINYEFDKVIIGPESFVEIEFSSARRVTIADSNFFYLLHSIKNGNEVYTINRLKSQTGYEDSEWEEENYDESDYSQDFFSEETPQSPEIEAPSSEEVTQSPEIEVPSTEETPQSLEDEAPSAEKTPQSPEDEAPSSEEVTQSSEIEAPSSEEAPQSPEAEAPVSETATALDSTTPIMSSKSLVSEEEQNMEYNSNPDSDLIPDSSPMEFFE